jgi:spore germination cell wall hydrolase CwlJ-like protein
MIRIALALLLANCARASPNRTQATEIIAATIIGEAGGEGYVGMQAVADVIMNRAVRSKLPVSYEQQVYEVVIVPYQFSCLSSVVVAKTKSWAQIISAAKEHPRWPYALELTQRIYNKTLLDITGGATHFHNLTVHPYWADRLTRTKRIGRHIFYK